MTMFTRLVAMTLGVSFVAGVSGCGGGGSSSSPSPTPSSSTSSSTSQATVNLVVSDTPSTAVTVLSFEVQITGAVLQPGNVSLLPRPVTVDLAQLVSDTGLLASSVIDSATYTSLVLTYADPQVTIQNNTGAVITAAGQTCAVGAACTFTPALNNASVTISNGVFPLTLTANSSTGLNLDLSIPDLLQSDLSITFADGKSVNLSLLGTGPAKIDDVLGSVTSVSNDQIGITTAFGDSLVLTAGSATAYNFPASICATPSLSCVATGQIVTVDLSMAGGGDLSIDSLAYVGAANSEYVKGLVLSTSSSGSAATANILVLRGVNVSSVTPGEVASVSVAGGATFGVATAAYPSVTGVTFSSAQDLLPGQEVIVGVGSDLITGSAPTFSTSNINLVSSQVIGVVGAINATGASLTLDGLTGVFSSAGSLVQSIDVQTGSDTAFVGFASLSAVTMGQLVVAKGPLFNSPDTGTSVLAATDVRARTTQD